MNKKAKKTIMQILISVILILCGCFLPLDRIMAFSPNNVENAKLIIFLLAYLTVARESIKAAVSNITSGHFLDENFLMAVASIGAFCIGDYTEGIAVMIFYQIGSIFEDYAVNKSRNSISDLMKIKPEAAYIINKDGTTSKVLPTKVNVGDYILVKPGEKVPVDGILVQGTGILDISALTGESIPQNVLPKDEVISGSICLDTSITIKVTKLYKDSAVAKILELVENASDKKSKAENFITRFAKYYTPIVVLLAIFVAVLPPLLFSLNYSTWILRGLTFLVVSCPCALVISVPLSFFGGIGAASSKGILVKGSNYLELLSKCDTILFDKTGTLTKGAFSVTEINIAKGNYMTQKQLLKIAAITEIYSNHPVATSIKKYAKEIFKDDYTKLEQSISPKDIKEISGFGLRALINNSVILTGSKQFLENNNVSVPENNILGTAVYIAQDSSYLGNIIINDELKPDATASIKELIKCGIKNITMLTGDNQQVAENVCNKLGIKKYKAKLLPQDKVAYMENVMKKKDKKQKVIFVGDGINDAPVLKRADVGISMGALGQDAAIEASDVVLMDDNPLGISKAIKIARKTLKIVWQNIVFALLVKVIVLILAVFGFAPMWLAIIADVGVAIIAILNALRCLKA